MERSDEKQKNAFRLYRRIRTNNTYRKKYYCVTVTPVGKNRSHKDTLQAFIDETKKYKVIIDVFLIAERENTNHFHGVIVCKDTCQFKRLYSKNQQFNFRISNQNLGDWCSYCVKHNPNKVYTPYGVERFEPIFLTDKTIVR